MGNVGIIRSPVRTIALPDNRIMVILGRLFAWRDALVNVRPDTFVRWHRKGFPVGSRTGAGAP